MPKRIVNEAIQGGAFKHGNSHAVFLEIGFTPPAFLGNGGRITLFPGFTVDQLQLLFGLSTLFLILVIINGAFKYWINLAKGALGERMLRRLRFDLFAITLRFTPNTLRTVKSSETATIIKDEVEPIGGFIGDAFVQPIMLGTQAATAMIFILMQNLWLGVLAAFVVGIQFVVIPRLRRIQLRLGKERQIASRKLAGRIGEVVDGMEAVHVHDAGRWERAEIGHRLYHIFDLRFRIYKWKFLVKFLNNMLAQITPFFFYAVGGYLALKGRLDIGQLVAVIGAYRDLPPPLKELIDWDQQRLDVQIKYDQIIQQFLPDRLLPEPIPLGEAEEEMHLRGQVTLRELRVLDAHGSVLVDGLSLEWPYPARVALVGDAGPAPSVVARVMVRRIIDYGGHVGIAGRELAQLPSGVLGRRMAYAGVDAILFPGSLRDNLVYGLRRKPRAPGPLSREETLRRLEADRTGNPSDSIHDDWIDYAAAGTSGPEDLDRVLLEKLALVELSEDVYRFGLLGLVDPDRHPELAERIVEARQLLRRKLADAGLAHLVEPFDPARYNNQASIGENLLFGASTRPAFSGRGRAANPLVRDVLDREGLTDDVVALGARIAETMTEIFHDLPPGHPLFEQFSFIAPDDLAEYQDIVRRWQRRGAGAMSRDDRRRLLALPLDYIETRHRLGLLDDGFRARIVAARARLREALPTSYWAGDLALYDPETLCRAAPLRDNLLFGRVAHDVADAQPKVAKLTSEVVEELGLREAIEIVGLDFQVGPAGRLLTPQQRAGLNLARGLVKNPDIMIVDGALAPYGEAQARRLMAKLLEAHADRCLVVVLRDLAQTEGFDLVVAFEGARGRIIEPEAEGEEEGRRKLAAAGQREL